MIDLVTIWPLSIGLKIKRLLPFTIGMVEDTGEIPEQKQSTKLKNLVFTITPGDNPIAKVKGSVHKYANDGFHNYNRFPLSRFRETARELSEYISPEDPVHVLEFGINIQTPFDPELFIRNLISFKGKRFNLDEHPGKLYSWAELGEYWLKIYDKGLPYNQDKILRLELKYKKMGNLFPNGLKWGDLLEPGTWQYLSFKLIESIEETVYFDPSIDLTTVTSTSDRELLEKGNNPFFWENFKGTNRSRKRKQFIRAVRKYGATFTSLPDLIKEEVSHLIDISATQKVTNFDHYFTPPNDTSISANYEKVTNFDTLLYGQNSSPTKTNRSGTDPEPYSEPIETGRRFCIVTGIDITDQKPGSRFLSTTGLRQLQRIDQHKFEVLRYTRLSDRFLDSPIDRQIKEIAHSIRNEYYNPKNNTKRAIQRIKSDPALFDQEPFFNPDRQKLIQGQNPSS